MIANDLLICGETPSVYQRFLPTKHIALRVRHCAGPERLGPFHPSPVCFLKFLCFCWDSSRAESFVSVLVRFPEGLGSEVLVERHQEMGHDFGLVTCKNCLQMCRKNAKFLPVHGVAPTLANQALGFHGCNARAKTLKKDIWKSKKLNCHIHDKYMQIHFYGSVCSCLVVLVVSDTDALEDKVLPGLPP